MFKYLQFKAQKYIKLLCPIMNITNIKENNLILCIFEKDEKEFQGHFTLLRYFLLWATCAPRASTSAWACSTSS